MLVPQHVTALLGTISLHTKNKELKNYFCGFLSHCCCCVYPEAGHPPRPDVNEEILKTEFPLAEQKPHRAD